MQDLLAVSEEVRSALVEGRPVVALETTLVAHGFPPPEGVEVGRASEEAVRAAGAVPATVGVLEGRIRAGLAADELERFTPAARKAGPRELALAAVRGETAAATAGATLAVAAALRIRFLGTGGIGGVHRGFPHPPDVSPDLAALARAPALVVASGVKSLLDVAATAEALEALGVPVLGFRTETLPLFYSAAGGPPAARVEDAEEAARVAAAHWRLGGGGLLLGNPPPESLDVEGLVEEALADARARGVSGQALTPHVLAFLHERSGGRTRAVNRALVLANARLAAEVAVAFAGR